MSGWNLVNPLWWLSRPQQAVFRAADEGSKAFEETLGDMNRADADSPVYNTAVAFGRSIPEMLSGAYKGMNPLSEDVQGSSLVGDLTDNPWINASAGVGLDIGGDPVGAINMGGKSLGIAYRTAKNLHKAEKEIPLAAQAMKESLGWKRYLTDVPLVEQGHPVMFKDTPLFPHEKIVPVFHTSEEIRNNPNKLGGTSFSGKDLIYVRDSPRLPYTLNHETAHWFLNPIWRSADDSAMFGKWYRQSVLNDLDKLGKEFRNTTLKADPFLNRHYGHKPDPILGGEAFARKLEKGNPFEVPHGLRDPAIQSLKISSNPGYMAPPPNVPLNVVYEVSKALGEENPWSGY